MCFCAPCPICLLTLYAWTSTCYFHQQWTKLNCITFPSKQHHCHQKLFRPSVRIPHHHLELKNRRVGVASFPFKTEQGDEVAGIKPEKDDYFQHIRSLFFSYRANTDSLHRLAIQTKLFIEIYCVQAFIVRNELLLVRCRCNNELLPFCWENTAGQSICFDLPAVFVWNCMVCCGHGIVEIIATKRGLPTCNFCPSEMLTLILYIYIYIFPMLRLRHICTILADFAGLWAQENNDKEVPHIHTLPNINMEP